MRENNHVVWRSGALVIALFLLLGACSDSDSASDTSAGGSSAVNGEQVEGDSGVESDEAAKEAFAETVPSLDSVWPLPPGEATVLFPFSDTNDGVVSRQAATFEMTGVDVETAITFYEDFFASTDYVVGDRLPLGESIALNISMPDNPNITAVVQATVQSNGKLTLNQERSERFEG